MNGEDTEATVARLRKILAAARNADGGGRTSFVENLGPIQSEFGSWRDPELHLKSLNGDYLEWFGSDVSRCCEGYGLTCHQEQNSVYRKISHGNCDAILLIPHDNFVPQFYLRKLFEFARDFGSGW